MRPVRFAFLLCCCIVPRVAYAQIIAIASNLLSKVENVGVYPIIPVSLDKESRDLIGRGVGLEFSFGIGDWTRAMTAGERARRCVDIRAEGKACDDAANATTTLTLTSVHQPAVDTTFDSSGRPTAINRRSKDSTWSVAIEPLEVRLMSFTLTVAHKLTPINSSTLVPGWQLRGKIQEFPTLTVYSAVRPDAWVSPYIGFTVAPGELKGLTVSQNDSVASIESSEIGYGGSLGIVVDVPRGGGKKIETFNLFAELDYTNLSFNTRGWKRPQNLAASELPERIRLQGWRLSAGIEFALSKD
jgi:hypothetical protein